MTQRGGELPKALESAGDFERAARFSNGHGQHATTIDLCRAGLARYPESALLHVYRAVAYDEFRRVAEATADCEAALRLSPAGQPAVYALTTLALMRERAGDHPGALAAVERAVTILPADRDAHALLGTLRAWHGDYRGAWPELECHWLEERLMFRRRWPERAEWDGESIAGQRLLIAHAQGLGDLLQMIRYVPRLRERCSEVVLECAPALTGLLRTVPGIGEVFARETVPRERFDVFARAMTLARLCGEDGSSGGSGVPYITADPARVERWAQRLGARDGRRRIGLVWAGNPQHHNDPRRSIALDAFAPFGSTANTQWFALQIGPRAADAAPAGLPLTRLADGITEMSDTAAILTQLDIVIAVDTSVAHLAGAMGVPAWVLLPERPDWRWSPLAAETPWYPAMRLFHAVGENWEGAIGDIVRALSAKAPTAL